jgi:hypothetical protein
VSERPCSSEVTVRGDAVGTNDDLGDPLMRQQKPPESIRSENGEETLTFPNNSARMRERKEEVLEYQL